MQARLFSKTGAVAGTDYVMENEAIIGRDSHCDLVLHPHSISSRHARIYFEPEKQTYIIEDLGSKNGTLVDKVAVTQPTPLEDLHVLTLAKGIDLVFQAFEGKVSKSSGTRELGNAPLHTELQSQFAAPPSLQSPPESPVEDKTTFRKGFDALPAFDASTEAPERVPEEDDTVLREPPPPPVKGGIAMSFAPKMIVQRADGSVKEFTLKPGVNVIGRLSSCDIQIADDYISGRHARIIIKNEKILVEDLGSRNKTFIDNKEINAPVEVEAGATIRFGPITKAILQ